MRLGRRVPFCPSTARPLTLFFYLSIFPGVCCAFYSSFPHMVLGVTFFFFPLYSPRIATTSPTLRCTTLFLPFETTSFLPLDAERRRLLVIGPSRAFPYDFASGRAFLRLFSTGSRLFLIGHPSPPTVERLFLAGAMSSLFLSPRADLGIDLSSFFSRCAGLFFLLGPVGDPPL